MADEPRESGIQTRAWQGELYGDVQFAHLVPAVKWTFFAGRIRPLTDPAASKVWDALFAGVNRPFDHDAGGWVMKVFRLMRPKAAMPGPAVAEELDNAFGWGGNSAAYLVFSSRQVYAATWADLLDCFRRGWVPVDNPCHNLYVCGNASDRVAAFMEGQGPYFARRKQLPL